jgi:hypothetical protein
VDLWGIYQLESVGIICDLGTEALRKPTPSYQIKLWPIPIRNRRQQIVFFPQRETRTGTLEGYFTIAWKTKHEGATKFG